MKRKGIVCMSAGVLLLSALNAPALMAQENNKLATQYTENNEVTEIEELQESIEESKSITSDTIDYEDEIEIEGTKESDSRMANQLVVDAEEQDFIVNTLLQESLIQDEITDERTEIPASADFEGSNDLDIEAHEKDKESTNDDPQDDEAEDADITESEPIVSENEDESYAEAPPAPEIKEPAIKEPEEKEATPEQEEVANNELETGNKKPAKPAQQVNPSSPKDAISQSLTETWSKSIFSNDSVSIPEEFETAGIMPSNLAGYTLPLRSSFEKIWQAALVYKIIQQVGLVVDETEPIENWIKEIFEEVMETNLDEIELIKKDYTDLQPGDIIYQDTGVSWKPLAIQLSDEHSVTIMELDHVEESEDEPEFGVVLTYLSTIAEQEQESFFVKRVDAKELTEVGENLYTQYPAPFEFQPNEETQAFIDTIAEDAQEIGLTYDVFASVTIAQAILESGSGTSGLSRAPYYNLFGIKGSYGNQSVVMNTNEDRGNGELYQIPAAFRSYPSYNDSLADYVQLIRGGLTWDPEYYEGVWRSNAKNYIRATEELTGSYATDVDYHKKLNSLIAAYDLTRYDQAPVSELGLFIENLDKVPSEYRQLMSLPVYDGRDYNLSGSYPIGQCTWYVFNRVAQLGGRVDDYMGNGGDWGATGRRLGYHVTQTPRVGTVISFSHGVAGSDPRYGHVAFVEAVGPNGILISEGNVYGKDTISYRVINNDLAKSLTVSYITPK
ncbi:glucosaminidase domain-containing protein [Enterococcus sp.]|uniref:glucosaminidase domain-containing protein n=1 Tax=Enterococcus sp. TaxID=35783 RepID=UPI0028AB6B16|nr:glucosaminidase domain-containing protein [Enterococcus sp.]